jgi:hypothetical protein
MDEFPGHREEVIPGQQARLAQRHDDGLLGWRERSVQPLRAVVSWQSVRGTPGSGSPPTRRRPWGQVLQNISGTEERVY